MSGEGEKSEEIETVINQPLLVIKVLSFAFFFFTLMSDKANIRRKISAA